MVFALAKFTVNSSTFRSFRHCIHSGARFAFIVFALLSGIALLAPAAQAQVGVYTSQNDISRTGQNLDETILTPANVNAGSFGKLFSQTVNGDVLAQPLYAQNVAVPGNGTHNIVYVATILDHVYAFDADNNGGGNAYPLWTVLLSSDGTPSGPYKPVLGVLGTPVIDPATKTMYLVSSESNAAGYVSRLHALDITTGAEKFGGPVLVEGSLPGTGSGSVDGTLTFNPTVQRQRPGLLLLNGVVYIGYGSVNDTGAWHGWLFSYNATSLKRISMFCTAANGSGGGIWMGGSGLAAEVNDTGKPYGRMFFSTGNGSYSATIPYSNTMNFGMSVLDMDLSGGVMTVKDEFTPYNEALLDEQDGDLGSGGPILLPPLTSGSGKTVDEIVEIGKSGDIYLLDRNGLGGFNSSSNQIIQSVQTPEGSYNHWGAGVWGAPAYWNGNVYVAGATPSSTNGIFAYKLSNGLIPGTPDSKTTFQFDYPAPIPAISANGTTNGIVWALGQDQDYALFAFDASNLGSQLYSSDTNAARDSPGSLPGGIAFTHPTIANGKVYVGGLTSVSVYGLLGATPTTASPVFVTPSEKFSKSLSVSITDATPNAKIFYTTDGSIPTSGSSVYAGPITITANTTINAFASAPGHLQSALATATYTASGDTADPQFSLAPGSYAGNVTVTLTDSAAGSSIYYTVVGAASTAAYLLYTKPIEVPVSETIQAYATAASLQPSPVVSAAYTIQLPYTFNFSQGFAEAQGPIQFNGSTDLDDIRLQLTDGGQYEAGSAFYTTALNISSFTTDFVFQISNPGGNGMTFTLQADGPKALGASGAGLGYSGLQHSIAIKFDITTPVGLGKNSVGLFANGALPTTPAIDLTNTGINLESGDQFKAHLTYDSFNLNLTLTDLLTLKTWSHCWPLVNIPAAIGSSSAWAGFTGGAGASSSSQKVTAWSWLPGLPVVPNYPSGFDAAQITFNPVYPVIANSLVITNGNENSSNAVYFAKPVGIDTFTTNFDFKVAPGTTSTLGEGLAFVIQNHKLNALGGGAGDLGYGGIGQSVAIKFDTHSNAGEGGDSTGLYINGATPTMPSANLSSSGVVLGSGHPIHAYILYYGMVLTVRLSDDITGAVWTGSFNVNIPSIVGANTAYVGFTGATSTATAAQTVTEWTYTTP